MDDTRGIPVACLSQYTMKPGETQGLPIFGSPSLGGTPFAHRHDTSKNCEYLTERRNSEEYRCFMARHMYNETQIVRIVSV